MSLRDPSQGQKELQGWKYSESVTGYRDGTRRIIAEKRLDALCQDNISGLLPSLLS